MSDDFETYRTATGQLPQVAARLDELTGGDRGDRDLTDEEVFAAIGAYGFSPDALPYVRAEPKDGQEHPGDRVFRFPLPMAGGMFLAVAWSFGQPSGDEIANWKVRWRSVDGPMTRAELEVIGRA